MLPPLDIPGLLRRYGLRPDKSLGQNFLIDPQALQCVVEAAGIHPQAAVLEIGPGLGSLTRLLAERARHVVAVELDASLIPVLVEVLASWTNVRLVQGDILTLNPSALMSEADRPALPDYLVVANIPYYITSALIRHLLETPSPPYEVVLTVQREVAERICAKPDDMSLLALSVQVYGNPRIAAHIPADAFYPTPKVDSAVVRIDLYPQPLIPKARLPLFFRLAKAGFSQRRKTLRNALSAGMHWPPVETGARLATAGIDAKRRAETLSLEEWAKLVDVAAQLPPE